jgi:hypothetical protein
MRKSVIIFGILCCVAAAAVVVWRPRKISPPVSAPAASSVLNQTRSQPSERAMTPTAIWQPAMVPAASPPVSKPVTVQSDSPTAPAPVTNAVSEAVDALLSANSAAAKHQLFARLRVSGQLEAVIAELKQRMAAHPNDAEIPATLGAAQLNQVRVIKEAGGDDDQMGILAMQADQSFNAALKIDPQNWEANFLKAASMYYWPANPQRDNEVVERLSGLIDRQETLAAQPEFAQTYVVLGNEYQKIGQPEKALATWQLGLQKFPASPELRQKVGGQ